MYRLIILNLLLTIVAISIIGFFVYMLHDSTGWECAEYQTVKVQWFDQNKQTEPRIQPSTICTSYIKEPK